MFIFFSSPLFNPNTRTPNINFMVKTITDKIKVHSVAFITSGNNPVAIEGARFDLMRRKISMMRAVVRMTFSTYVMSNWLTEKPMVAVIEEARKIFDGCLIHPDSRYTA